MSDEPQKATPSTKSVFTLQKTLQLATEFGFIIALPVIAFGLGGKWLDKQYHHVHLFTLLGMLLALAMSVTYLSIRINTIRKSLVRIS